MAYGYVPIPFVIEKTGRGERQYDIYSRLLEDRIVMIGSPIDDTVANVVIAQLLFLQKENKQRLLHGERANVLECFAAFRMQECFKTLQREVGHIQAIHGEYP